MKAIADIRHDNFMTILENENKSIQEMADKMNKSHARMSHLKNRVKNIGDKQAREIEVVFDKPYGWMDASHIKPESNASMSVGMEKWDGSIPMDGLKFVENMNVSKVPLIAWEDIYTVAYSNSAVQSDKVIKYMEFSYDFSDKSFALTVISDAMLPDFPEGAFIAIDPTVKPVSGNFVVAKNNIGEYTFRKFIIDSGIAYLKPLNNDFPIVEFDINTIVGVVAEMKRIFI